MVLLEMKHITKRFQSVIANEDVNLQVQKGEVHALLGENGAGKSTLMNILYGMYAQSEGEIYLKGERIRIKDPKDAITRGIGMVHQHFMLIPALTVIENVVLGMKENKGVLDLHTAAKSFIQMAEKYNMHIDPWEKVSRLSIGQQQRLEILKALYRKAQLLILDEPTAVLTPTEVTSLFEMIRQLTQEGHTVIFISHKLTEIMEICDRCTVLRQGRVVASVKIEEVVDKQHLATLMVGKNVELVTHKEISNPGKTVLLAEAICYENAQKVQVLDSVSIEARQGEILGICGVDGNGQSELIKCITGLFKPKKGKVMINGTDCTAYTPKQILAHNVAHIPEDRHKMGMIKEMSIKENLILMSYDKGPYSKGGILNWKWINKHSQKLCKAYNVKTPDIMEKAGNLSGGNQQKFVVGRELDRKPDLLIAMHPDRGLDIGATKYIQARIVEERDRGAAVVLVSTELDEILELSDRIVVMYEGKIMGTMDQKEATREKLGLLMAGIAV
ncbi:ABC transporter ATP-binding protein [Cellulosilyticum sp. I15G10I2]|uniref:ABC transporter ATP-binding protein n=1 Tax=Cellulosilyticum sp. I15G10I2 TaxID=1892843 RepID=UPI00085C3FCB|nr:ABC transporter ATP-binding protein [Cellulosilyticum sp. I15G10I2]